MRLLHTSDWHLGRSFHGFGLLDAQARFLEWLLDVVRQESVTVVAVAGDIYDRAIPPVDAVELYDETLVRFSDAGVTLVLTSGNHDSATRLGVGARVLSRGGVHVRTSPRAIASPVLVADGDRPVALYGIPYLEPDAVRHELGLSERSHQAALDAAMTLVRDDLATQPQGTRSVVLSHSFVTGGTASDSERDIRVGGADNVAASTFAGVDYVALGHLHGPQHVSDSVAYSGSPVAYSFSERTHRKSVSLVDIAPDGPVSTRRIPVPVQRPLSAITGDLQMLLTDPRHDQLAGHYVQVTLTDQGAPSEPMARLRQRFPYVATLAWEPAGGLEPGGRSYVARLSGRSDTEICCDFVRHVRNDEASEEERRLLVQALEAGRGDKPTAPGPTAAIPEARRADEELTASRRPEEVR